MFKDIKESLKTVAYYGLGATAIVGEKLIDVSKDMMIEVKSGRPQAQVKFTYYNAKQRIKDLRNRKAEECTNP